MAGKGRQRTSIPDAAKAAAMYEAGIPVREISEETDLSKRTIYNILSGEYKWREILDNDERYKEYKRATTRGMEVNCWELAKKSFIHAEEKLPDASYAQGVFGGAILVDKARLLAGEATEIHEVITREKLESLEDLNEKLQKAVAHRILAAKVIEVKPTGNGSPNQ